MRILILLSYTILATCCTNALKLNAENQNSLDQLFGVGYNAIVYEFILHRCPPPLPDSNDSERIICPKSYVYRCDSIYLYDQVDLTINGRFDSIRLSVNNIPTFREPILTSKLTDENDDFIFKDFMKCSVSMDRVFVDKNRATIEGSKHSSENFFEYTLYFERKNKNCPWRYVKGVMGGFN